MKEKNEQRLRDQWDNIQMEVRERGRKIFAEMTDIALNLVKDIQDLNLGFKASRS